MHCTCMNACRAHKHYVDLTKLQHLWAWERPKSRAVYYQYTGLCRMSVDVDVCVLHVTHLELYIRMNTLDSRYLTFIIALDISSVDHFIQCISFILSLKTHSSLSVLSFVIHKHTHTHTRHVTSSFQLITFSNQYEIRTWINKKILQLLSKRFDTQREYSRSRSFCDDFIVCYFIRKVSTILLKLFSIHHHKHIHTNTTTLM